MDHQLDRTVIRFRTILFSIAGNSVNGDGIPNEYDYWNILTFSQSIRQVLLLREMVMLPYKLAQLRLVITKHFSSLKKVSRKRKGTPKEPF